MTLLVVDTESSIFQKGNPFAQRNRNCYLGALSSDKLTCLDVRNDSMGLLRDQYKECIEAATLLIGFNIKYDLHWFRREGIDFAGKKIWCCQTAHFLLTNQRKPYPSLDEVCAHYDVPGKFGFIEENYWSKGVDTPDIPKEEMLSYLEQDLRCTYSVYQKQMEELGKRPEIANLLRMNMDDLLVLEDMEWNGLRLNVEETNKKAEQVRNRVKEIDAALSERCPNVPINWDSPDHLSAYFYGGLITIERREPVGFYKTGKKTGEVRYQKVEDIYTIPRLVTPVEGSELKKEGLWSTAEDVLKQVKQLKEVRLFLERSELSKLLDYLEGWPKLMMEKDWKRGEVHGQFNQVVARTGRLSSSSPNLQNLPDPVLALVETRYAS